MKGVWLCHVTQFKFGCLIHMGSTIHISGMAEARAVNFVQLFARWQFSIGIIHCLLNGRGHGHVTSLSFRK